MIYAKAFFDLQLRCAHKVTTLSGLPLSRVLLEYTNLYIRFGLGRDFNPAHPTWQAYLAGLRGAPDIPEWTYDFYVTRHDAMAEHGLDAEAQAALLAADRDALVARGAHPYLVFMADLRLRMARGTGTFEYF